MFFNADICRICPARNVAYSALWITVSSLIAAFNLTESVDEKGKVIEVDLRNEDPDMVLRYAILSARVDANAKLYGVQETQAFHLHVHSEIKATRGCHPCSSSTGTGWHREMDLNRCRNGAWKSGVAACIIP